MGDGRVNLSAAGQSVAEVVVGLGVVGLDFQGLLVMGDGRVNLSAASQGVAEVVVGFRVVGLDFQGLLVMGDGRVNCRRGQARELCRGYCGIFRVVGLDLPGPSGNGRWPSRPVRGRPGLRRGCCGPRRSRADFQRLLVMGNGLVNLATAGQSVTELVVGYANFAKYKPGRGSRAVSLSAKTMSDATHSPSEPPAPMPKLTPHIQRRYDQDRVHVRHSPSQGNAQPDLWQVGEAVGHGLRLRPAPARSPAPASPDTRASPRANTDTAASRPTSRQRCPPAAPDAAADLPDRQSEFPGADRRPPVLPAKRTDPGRQRRKPGRWPIRDTKGRRSMEPRRPHLGPKGSPRRNTTVSNNSGHLFQDQTPEKRRTGLTRPACPAAGRIRCRRQTMRPSGQ